MVSELIGCEGVRKTAAVQRQTALALIEDEREVVQLPVATRFRRKLRKPRIELLMSVSIQRKQEKAEVDEARPGPVLDIRE